MMNKKQETIKFKKSLKILTNEIAKSLSYLDLEMKKPGSHERGKRIAKIWNKMKFDNDSALHFGLGVDLDKLDKYYTIQKHSPEKLDLLIEIMKE